MFPSSFMRALSVGQVLGGALIVLLYSAVSLRVRLFTNCANLGLDDNLLIYMSYSLCPWWVVGG